jgi:BclA C-terminal domain
VGIFLGQPTVIQCQIALKGPGRSKVNIGRAIVSTRHYFAHRNDMPQLEKSPTVLRVMAGLIAVGLLAVLGVNLTGSGSASAVTIHDAAARTQAGSGSGYWLVTSTGQVYSYGGATYYGGMSGRHLNKPIVGIASTSDGKGYWLIAADGGVFAFGDATFAGSRGSLGTSASVVGGAGAGLASTTGPPGPAGATGPAGPTGATGPQGPAGQPDYGYVYNTSAETVPIESDITFDTNGPLSGFTHTVGTAEIGVAATGTYLVTFSVSGVEPGQFTLMNDGTAVPGTTYGSGAGTQQDNGQVIVTLTAADSLTLRNHSSAAAVTLQTLAGGTQTTVNASILIDQLG